VARCFPVLGNTALREKSRVSPPKYGSPVASATRADAELPRASGAQPLPGLIERVKNILLTPRTEWAVIEAERTTVGQLYSRYIAPLAAFAAAMSFIRMSVIGVSLPLGGTIRTSLSTGIVSSLVTFILGLIGLFLVGLIINMLAPAYSGARNERQALKTAAYALTPAWLGTALTLLPFGPVLQLVAGIYAIYVLHLGLPVMMRTPRDKVAGYTAMVIVCALLVGILFGAAGAMLGAAAAQAH
jgi:Yip1 domain